MPPINTPRAGDETLRALVDGIAASINSCNTRTSAVLDLGDAVMVQDFAEKFDAALDEAEAR